MRRRVGTWLAAALLVVGPLALGVPAGPAAGADTGDDLGGGLLLGGQATEAATWNGTYTPESEAGAFRDGIRTEDGGYVLAGRFGPEGEADWNALAVKVDDAGEVEWVWSLQGYGTATLTSAVELGDCRVLLAGTQATQDRGERWFVAVLSTDGEVRWRDTYDNGTLWDAVRVPDGGALLVGEDRATVITPSGAEIWSARYEDAGVTTAARAGDGYVLAGVDTSRADPDRLLMRIDGTGDVEWREHRESPGPDRYTDVVVGDGTIYAAGTAPLGEANEAHPSVSAYHANGSRDWQHTSRADRPRVPTAVALGDPGTVAVVPGDGGARLSRFAFTAAGRTVDLDASPNSLTAVGDGRYLYAGHRGEDAAAGVVAPSFENGGRLVPPTTATGNTGSGQGESGSEGEGADGSTNEDGGGIGVPSFSVGGVPPLLTQLLVGAAAVGSIAAVAVTAIALRRM